MDHDKIYMNGNYSLHSSGMKIINFIQQKKIFYLAN